MKRVIYSMYHKPEGATCYMLEEVGEADFHEFGVGYEELDHGAGNYSTAILELDNGQVLTVPAEHIRFLKDELSPAFGDMTKALDNLSIRK